MWKYTFLTKLGKIKKSDLPKFAVLLVRGSKIGNKHLLLNKNESFQAFGIANFQNFEFGTNRGCQFKRFWQPTIFKYLNKVFLIDWLITFDLILVLLKFGNIKAFSDSRKFAVNPHADAAQKIEKILFYCIHAAPMSNACHVNEP